MAAGTPMSAKAAKVRLNATTMYHTNWEVTMATNWADTTNFEGAGYYEEVACITQVDVTLSGWLDVGANPFDTPGIISGARIANLLLYCQNTTGPVWTITSFDVHSAKVTASVKDEIKLEIVGRGHGSFSDPTGNL